MESISHPRNSRLQQHESNIFTRDVRVLRAFVRLSDSILLYRQFCRNEMNTQRTAIVFNTILGVQPSKDRNVNREPPSIRLAFSVAFCDNYKILGTPQFEIEFFQDTTSSSSLLSSWNTQSKPRSSSTLGCVSTS